MSVLVERTFEVGIHRATAWSLLSMVERWPEWAPHIKHATLDQPTLGPSSSGSFSFRPIGSGSFAMTGWDPPLRWTWRGTALGLPIDYHHAFEEVDGHHSRLTWTVELVNAQPSVRSALFARVYSRNIDRAWPRFVRWVETQADV